MFNQCKKYFREIKKIIFFYSGGCPIPDSPLICTVDAAGQARAKGEGLLSGHTDKTAHFIVTGTRSPPAVQVLSKKCNISFDSHSTWILLYFTALFLFLPCFITIYYYPSLGRWPG